MPPPLVPELHSQHPSPSRNLGVCTRVPPFAPVCPLPRLGVCTLGVACLHAIFGSCCLHFSPCNRTLAAARFPAWGLTCSGGRPPARSTLSPAAATPGLALLVLRFAWLSPCCAFAFFAFPFPVPVHFPFPFPFPVPLPVPLPLPCGLPHPPLPGGLHLVCLAFLRLCILLSCIVLGCCLALLLLCFAWLVAH